MTAVMAPKGSVTSMMDFVEAQAAISGLDAVKVARGTVWRNGALQGQQGTLAIGDKNYTFTVREDASRPDQTPPASNAARLDAIYSKAQAAVAAGDINVITATDVLPVSLPSKYSGLPKPAQAEVAAEGLLPRRSIEVEGNGKRMSFQQTVDGNGTVDYVSKGNNPKALLQWMKEEAQAAPGVKPDVGSDFRIAPSAAPLPRR